MRMPYPRFPEPMGTESDIADGDAVVRAFYVPGEEGGGECRGGGREDIAARDWVLGFHIDHNHASIRPSWGDGSYGRENARSASCSLPSVTWRVRLAVIPDQSCVSPA